MHGDPQTVVEVPLWSGHWRSYVVKYVEVRFSQVKPSHAVMARRKISFSFHFWQKIFHPWWCESCRVI